MSFQFPNSSSTKMETCIINTLGNGVYEYRYYNCHLIAVAREYGSGMMDGVIQETEYKRWYDNGVLEIKTSSWNGKLDGIRTIFYEDGRPEVEEFYRHGALIDPLFTRKKREIFVRMKRYLKAYPIFNVLNSSLIRDLSGIVTSFIPG